jgi:outer membrane lipoprotein carrier protein
MQTVALFLALAATLSPVEAPAPAKPAPAKPAPAKAVVAKTAPAEVAQAPAKIETPIPREKIEAAAEVTRIVDAMQKAYEDTKDFSANFTQRYTYTLLRRTQESKGRVLFKKPGLMRWDYAAPNEKAFIVDGKALWVHQPEDKTALVDRCFKQDGLTASVAFLWGAGDIRKQFNVKRFGGVFGEKTDEHLELTPKSKNNVFAKLILVLDPKTARVKQSIVVDPQGNVNQFIYDEARFNSNVDQKQFAFKAPKGTHVSPIPGSCRK